MEWSAFRHRLLFRTDVVEECRFCGFTSLDELLAAADRGLADGLVIELADRGSVGIEVALAVLAPHLERAARGLQAWSGEDIGELVAAACWERLQRGSLPPRPTRSVVDQARKTVLRELQRSWRRATVTAPLHEATTDAMTSPVTRTMTAATMCVEDEALQRLSESNLVEWVMRAADLDQQTARIVVHSRAWNVPMNRIALAEGLTYHTAYRRRQRAERKLRNHLERRLVSDPVAVSGP